MTTKISFAKAKLPQPIPSSLLLITSQKSTIVFIEK